MYLSNSYIFIYNGCLLQIQACLKEIHAKMLRKHLERLEEPLEGANELESDHGLELKEDNSEGLLLVCTFCKFFYLLCS